MRNEGISLTRAASDAGTTSRVAQKYVGSALQRSPRGRYSAITTDRFYRRMTVITVDGPKLAEVRGSRMASLAAKHANAVRKFAETGDASDLRRFRGKSVGGEHLATDPATIKRLAHRGELDFEDIYDLTL
jgi:hypothetical protein